MKKLLAFLLLFVLTISVKAQILQKELWLQWSTATGAQIITSDTNHNPNVYDTVGLNAGKNGTLLVYDSTPRRYSFPEWDSSLSQWFPRVFTGNISVNDTGYVTVLGGIDTLAGDVTGLSNANTVKKWFGVALNPADFNMPGDAEIPMYVSSGNEYNLFLVTGDGTLSNTAHLTVTGWEGKSLNASGSGSFAAPPANSIPLWDTGGGVNKWYARQLTGGISVNDTGYVTVTAGTIPVPLKVDSGGTGVVTLTAHSVLLGEGTNPIGQAFTPNSNYLLVSQAGGDPFFSPASAVGLVTSVTATYPLVSSGGSTPNIADSGFHLFLGASLALGIKTGNVGTATGDSNTWIGDSVGLVNTTGTLNTIMGCRAMMANTTGWQNTAVGFHVLNANTTGIENTALGGEALAANTTGHDNTAIGVAALSQSTAAAHNTAVGRWALNANTAGDSDVAVGSNALKNEQGSYNTAIGANVLAGADTGSDLTMLGYGAGVGSTHLTNATAVGALAVVNTSNSIQLGNSSVTLINTTGTYKTSGGVNLTGGAFTDSAGATGNIGDVLGGNGSGKSPTWTSSSTGKGCYGDGSDGALILDGTHTYSFLTKNLSSYRMTRDIYATTITISPTAALITNNYRIFANTIIIDSGIIMNLVNNGVGQTGGAATNSTGTLANNAAGANGVTTNTNGTTGTPVSFSMGAASGSGGNCAPNSGGGVGSATAIPASAGAPRTDQLSIGYLIVSSGSVQAINGGAGGASGASAGAGTSGGGGAGGGQVNIHARTFTFAGSMAFVMANGGNGGNASGTNAGGGAGGGGGWILLETDICTPSSPTIGSGNQVQMLGGTGGNGVGTGTNGNNGSNSPSSSFVLILN